jgi:hypothetical protein
MPSSPTGTRSLNAFELLRFTKEWRETDISKDTFIEYLMNSQDAITSNLVYRTTFDGYVDNLLSSHQMLRYTVDAGGVIRRDDVLHLLDEALALAHILNLAEMVCKGEALLLQYNSHVASKLDRLVSLQMSGRALAEDVQASLEALAAGSLQEEVVDIPDGEL